MWNENEWSKELMDQYPSMFEKCFDFSVGSGWKYLIEGTVKAIYLIDRSAQVAQIKEKFGTLRFYMQTCSSEHYEQIHKIIHVAERASALLCENCGDFGELDSSRFWLQTLCPECKKKRK